jgi:rhodanese-related sulfurtransferase
MPLSDDLIVYPNHGAGSACGKMMSKETTDTLGHQKRVNYALDPKLSKEEFIEIVLSGLTNPPVYFPQNVLLNIRGYESLDVVLERALSPLNVDAFEAAANETSALILDTREANSFAKAFIPNSVNIGIDGSFAQWVGEMVTDVKQPILLVTEPGREKECAIRLSRVGYDNTLGYLEGGMKTWIEAGKEIDQSRRISPLEFANEISSKKILVIDVRKKSEFDSEHVLDSLNIPLNEINVHLSSIPKTEKFLLICAGGYRSMIAASILRQRGWNNFVDVEGGFAEIKKTNAPCSSFVCPTTLL